MFILDLRNPPSEDPHSFKHFVAFQTDKIDVAVCFDTLGVREDVCAGITALWDRHQTAVIDILMDPPLRFHPAFESLPQNYILFCCDREHVEYVKQYFGEKVPRVSFLMWV